MLIIVTGAIGIGKTTVCQKLVQMARSQGYSCGGIVTLKAPDGSIIVEDVKTGNHKTLASTSEIYDGPRTPKYFFNQTGIEFGIKAIEVGISADILFVDEIGHLELGGEGFFKAIELINTGKAKRSVLVIRKELLPLFLPRLSSEPLVFEVAEDNRNELPQEIWSFLSSSLTLMTKPVLVSAILLAAGESKRLGGEKLLLPLVNSTVLERTIDNLLGSRVDEVIVVVGHRAQEMKQIIGDRPVKIVVNEAYQQGMSTSIIKGLKMVDNRASAVMLALADQPFIGSALINRLVEEFVNNKKGIVLPVYEGKRGHPVIFSIKYKEELLNLEGDVGGREIVSRHPDDLLEVEVDSESIFTDIDTIESYHSLLYGA